MCLDDAHELRIEKVWADLQKLLLLKRLESLCEKREQPKPDGLEPDSCASQS